MKTWNGRSGYAGRKHRLRNIILLLVALAVLCFAALEGYIWFHGRDRLAGQPEVMVIFGCQVKPWGPSILLQDRLDTALDYLEEHPDITVVVTGGKGSDEHMSEAQCMYHYLTEQGFAGPILMEDQSWNTWQNVNYTLDLLAEAEYDITGDVLLVSSGFHLSRVEMLWNRARTQRLQNGVDSDQVISTLAAPTSHAPSAMRMFFREPLALVKSWLLDR